MLYVADPSREADGIAASQDRGPFMVKEGLISSRKPCNASGPTNWRGISQFSTPEESKSNPLGKGLPAGPGAAGQDCS